MTESNRYLGVDLGASGGTLYTGWIGRESIAVTEVSRFGIEPQRDSDRYVWDIDSFVEKIADGIANCESKYGEIDSIGIDTWGTDFGFLESGRLLQPPYSYRDPKLTSTREELFESVSRRSIFEATGVCHWDMATSLYHLHYLVSEEPEVIERADQLLMMPQLLSTFLGGKPVGEETVASTTQMMDSKTRDWARDLLTDVDIPVDILPNIKRSGHIIGELDPDYATDEENSPDIVLPASHDTASAVTALPFDGENRMFLSTGTMFLPGIELDEPNRSMEAFEIGASNELGLSGTVRFIKNMNGFFLLEECRKWWQSTGKNVEYESLLENARKAEPLGPLIDPDHAAFEPESEMPVKIREYCLQTEQRSPSGVGEITRCILESLVVKVAVVIEGMCDVTDDRSDRIHLGGGGVRNELLCQTLADATNREVIAGPAEATAIGNLLSQALGRGDIRSLEAGRELVEESFDLRTYSPEASSSWEGMKDRMTELLTEPPQM
jgi:rhamnulokinase